jgi:peptidoglycan/LPS O-acetylase OafA/YrhL
MISPYMRKVFERPVFLHLGNLSYSVYIIHVPFIQTIAVPVILLVCEDMLSGPNGAGLAVGFFVTTALIVLPLLLWLAGMFSTYVERPCTQFGQFVYEVAALEQIGIEH